jgi:hypothetical protein
MKTEKNNVPAIQDLSASETAELEGGLTFWQSLGMIAAGAACGALGGPIMGGVCAAGALTAYELGSVGGSNAEYYAP